MGKVPNQGGEGSTETKLQKTLEVWKFWEGEGGSIKKIHTQISNAVAVYCKGWGHFFLNML